MKPSSLSHLPALAHLPGLDGIRGLAVILVILFHSALITPIGVAAQLLHKLTLTGWIGVDLFFVLSGFLITRILVNKKESAHYFLNFYMRRALRIFPLFYLFLFLFLVVFPEKVQFDFTYWIFLSNILIGRLGQFQSGVLDVTWSLALEEQFYLLWPFLVFFLSKRKIRKAAIGLFFLALAVRISFYFGNVNPMKSYVLLPCRLDCFAVGAYLASSELKLQSKRFWQVFFVLAGSVLFVFSFGFNFLDPVMRTWGYSVNALFAGAVISFISFSQENVLTKLFKNGFLRSCGKYSYAMYLFHVPVIHWTFWVGRDFWSSKMFLSKGSLMMQILFHLTSLLVTWALARVLYSIFEKHFLKLKKLFNSAPSSSLSPASALN